MGIHESCKDHLTTMKKVIIFPVIIFSLLLKAENLSGDGLEGAMEKILNTMTEMSDRIQILEEHMKRQQPSLIPGSYQCGYQPRWGDYNGFPADGPICYDR